MKPKKEAGPKLTVATSATISEEYCSSHFAFFERLPTGLRVLLKIWGFGAPDPYLVAQEEFLNFKYRFSYNRPVPAVLHACRESRQEFLESDETSTDGPLAIRRRDHPVNKLSFHRETHSSSPIFFFAIDSFCGCQCSTVPQIPLREDTDPEWAWGYSGIASLDIAKKLRSLVLDYKALSLVYEASYFPEKFPLAENLTLLLRHYPHCSTDHPHHLPTEHTNVDEHIIWIYERPIRVGTFGPEIDGEVNTSYMSSEHVVAFKKFRAYLYAPLMKGAEQYPDWTAPVLKIRLRAQFMESEGIISGAGTVKFRNECSLS